MSREIRVGEARYISSKRASEIMGYSQDYIGQLARKELIDAERVGGLWYLSLESLENYKKGAEGMKKPEPPVRGERRADAESIISLDGKDYISAPRAAEITGYHQDYVGQLAREGKVLSRQVGARWYVERKGVREHKEHKDALLAAVQARSVGLLRHTRGAHEAERLSADSYEASPLFTYISDAGDLLPIRPLTRAVAPDAPSSAEHTFEAEDEDYAAINTIPIRVLREGSYEGDSANALLEPQVSVSRRSLLAVSATAVLTIVLVLAVGYALWPTTPIFTDRNVTASTAASTAGILGVLDRIGATLESFLVPEMAYTRGQ